MKDPAKGLFYVLLVSAPIYGVSYFISVPWSSIHFFSFMYGAIMVWFLGVLRKER